MLLDREDTDVLYVSAAFRNQGKVYDRFNHTILLTAGDGDRRPLGDMRHP